MQSIRPHNEQAAATWGAGGQDYDKISENVSDAIEHLVRRILPVPANAFSISLPVPVGQRVAWRPVAQAWSGSILVRR